MSSRLQIIGSEEAEGDVAHYFDATEAFLGRVPNSARVLAHSPYVAKMYLAFNASLQREGVGSFLSSKIKEMVILKTSQVNSCEY